MRTATLSWCVLKSGTEVPAITAAKIIAVVMNIRFTRGVYTSGFLAFFGLSIIAATINRTATIPIFMSALYEKRETISRITENK